MAPAIPADGDRVGALAAVAVATILGTAASFLPVEPATQRHAANLAFVATLFVFLLLTDRGRRARIPDFAVGGIVLLLSLYAALIVGLAAAEAGAPRLAAALVRPYDVIAYIPHAPDAPPEIVLALWSPVLLALVCGPVLIVRAARLFVLADPAA